LPGIFGGADEISLGACPANTRSGRQTSATSRSLHEDFFK